jgi:hypothetical protein
VNEWKKGEDWTTGERWPQATSAYDLNYIPVERDSYIACLVETKASMGRYSTHTAMP